MNAANDMAPPSVPALLSSDGYTLGIDIGGTNLRVGLIDRQFGVCAFEKHSVGILAGENPAARLAAFAAAYIQKNGAADRVRAVCVGFPATVDKQGETVLNAPNLQGFDGVNVKKILAEALPCPIIIEKDVNLLLLCDVWRCQSNARDIVACYVGTGLGNAIIIDGKPIRGHHGVAGELGHISFGDSDCLCGCGNRGCAETLVGGNFLVKLCEAQFAGTHVSELFCHHSQDPAVGTYLDRLARVIASEVNILDPELLILGGGVINMAGFPKDRLCDLICGYVRKPLPCEDLKIEFSSDADTCGVIGAGIRAWNECHLQQGETTK